MLSKLKLSKFKGFTLAELLIVIAIIGILSTVIIVSLAGARAKARDAKKISDMTQVAAALQLYYADNHKYYVSTSPTPPTTEAAYYTAMTSALVSGRYLTNPPVSSDYKYAVDATCIGYKLYSVLETSSNSSWSSGGKYYYGIKNGEKCTSLASCAPCAP